MKIAKILGFIGSLILLIISIIWGIDSVYSNSNYKILGLIPYLFVSILAIIGEAFITVFFFILIQKNDLENN